MYYRMIFYKMKLFRYALFVALVVALLNAGSSVSAEREEELILEMPEEEVQNEEDDSANNTEENIPEAEETGEKKNEIKDETTTEGSEIMDSNSITVKTEYPQTMYEKTKQQMLDLKNGTRTLDDSDFGIWTPQPKSLLQYEQNGGLPVLSRENESMGLDVLTGKSSLEDGMQLGDFSSATEVENHFFENAKKAIMNFKMETGGYPHSLDDFQKYDQEWWAEISLDGEQKNISEMKEILEYTPVEEKTGKKSILCSGSFDHLTNPDATSVSTEYKDELREANPPICQTKNEMLQHESGCCFFTDTEVTAFTLTLKQEPKNDMIDLSEVKPIETKSHNYAELIQAEKITVDVPEIAHIIPADSFVVHFDSAEKYTEFSKALKNLFFDEFSEILPIHTPEKMEQMIATRLGIPNAIEFLSLVEEIAFVGEDIRLFPSSDYAVIVRWKQEGNSLIASLLQNGKNAFGEIGEYFVFATSQSLLNDISDLSEQKGDRKPLSTEDDYRYTLGITEQNREGFVFFSDAFLRKITSPEYRIALRRQKSVRDAMNALQYAVWAYKELEGSFPKTWEEMEKAGYIIENSISQAEKYTIGENGIIQHELWGTPFSLTPLTRVEITSVSEQEKTWYETGRDIYQSQYQQFFDPIGISITLADKILFHTVILPVSENEEYKRLEAIGGRKTKETFDLLSEQKSVIEGAFVFDFESVIFNIFANDSQKTPQEAVADFEQEFTDEMLSLSEKWAWEGRIFDFLGDEIGFGIGKNLFFDIQDVSGIDGFVGVLLKDAEKAENLFSLIFDVLAQEMGGDTGFRIFQFQGVLKNEYNGVEYYVIPNGFVNLYAIFLEDRAYFAVSQNTINNIIDGTIDGGVSFSRLDTFLRGEKNTVLRADFQEISAWLDSLPKEVIDQVQIFSGKSEMIQAAEREELQKILGEDFMNTYFVHKNDILGYTPKWENRIFFWEKNGNRFSPEEIDRTEIIENAKNAFMTVGKAGLSFAFTKHGAEIKIAFNNPELTEEDDRFITLAIEEKKRDVAGTEKGEEKQKTPPEEDPISALDVALEDVGGIPRFVIYGLIGAGLTTIVLCIIFLLRRRKTNATDDASPEQKKKIPIDFDALEMDSDIPKHYAQYAKKHTHHQTQTPSPIHKPEHHSPPPTHAPAATEKKPQTQIPPAQQNVPKKESMEIDDILEIPKSGATIEKPADLAKEKREIQNSENTPENGFPVQNPKEHMSSEKTSNKKTASESNTKQEPAILAKPETKNSEATENLLKEKPDSKTQNQQPPIPQETAEEKSKTESFMPLIKDENANLLPNLKKRPEQNL
jgi:hypothetical protein